VGRAAAAGITAIAEGLDYEAGLADVYRRARRAGQVWPRHQAWGEMLPHELARTSLN